MESAVVVYDPWFDCTRLAAEQIATGISLDGRVPAVVSHAHEVTARHVQEHDLVVVGSPDRHGAPTPIVAQLLTALRDFDLRAKRLAFFETTFIRSRGRTTARMAEILRRNNPYVLPPFPAVSVLVQRPHGPPLPGQLSICREFGRTSRMSLPLPA